MTAPRVEASEKPKPTFGFTRYGKYTSPNPILIGRHDSVERLKGNAPGFTFYEAGRTGQDKPHALILSRPKFRTKGIDVPEFQNIFGWTRFGKAGTPSAVLQGRPKIKAALQPGPGAYELDGCDECRIGISLKGRWQQGELEGRDAPGPKYALPNVMGTGPAYSLSSKYPDLSVRDCSPGPIYLVHPERKPGAGLTFKPFPMTSQETSAGPASFNTMEAAKKTMRSAPATKFGKAFCTDCDWSMIKDTSTGPGPGAFNIRDCPNTGPSPPVAFLASRPSTRIETHGAGFFDLSGMTRFGANGKKGAILVSRHEPPKNKFETGAQQRYNPSTHEGDAKFKSKKIGIKIKSRLKGLELNNFENPGPGSYNVGGSIGTGPAFSLGPKHRRPIGQSDQLHTVMLRDTSECQPKGKALDGVQDSNKEPQRIRIPPPASEDIYDMIPYLEQLCTNY